MILIKNQAPYSTFDAKCKPSHCIVKKIGKKAFDVQDQTGKMKRVCAEHMQFMYLTEYYLTAFPKKEIFGRTAKYINNPNLMPDLHKDLGETNNKQGDYSGKQNDQDNSNITTHNYNLHSRTVHRL